MDYLEIMNFCGFDLDKAHEMAKEKGAKEFSESIKRTAEKEDEDVYRV